MKVYVIVEHESSGCGCNSQERIIEWYSTEERAEKRREELNKSAKYSHYYVKRKTLENCIFRVILVQSSRHVDDKGSRKTIAHFADIDDAEDYIDTMNRADSYDGHVSFLIKPLKFHPRGARSVIVSDVKILAPKEIVEKAPSKMDSPVEKLFQKQQKQRYNEECPF